MKALVLERNLPRFAAARLAAVLGSGRGASVGPLRLVDVDAPLLPGEDWQLVRPSLSGICGSDLATVDGRTSRYFDDLVSWPFVPGHEVVGTLWGPARSVDGGVLEAGQRVVIEPVLACGARSIDPPCPACAAGQIGNCERATFGHLRPGLQTGYCADTGGGWSAAGLVAHASQLHPVPDALADEDAVLVEPLACGIHAACSADLQQGAAVAVLGAGTVGLAVTAAVRFLADSGRCARPAALIVGARYRHQRAWASRLGATAAVPADQLARAVRRESGSLAIGTPGSLRRLSGGADLVFDCVGSSASIEQALGMVRPRGQVVLVGMPGRLHVDLAPLWHREVRVSGAYAYGTERTGERTFALALELARQLRESMAPGHLVSAAYPLERFEEALVHAGNAGRRGAVKIVFDLRRQGAVGAGDGQAQRTRSAGGRTR